MAIAFVLDNDPTALQHTVSQLKESADFAEIYPFEDSQQAVRFIELKNCDVVFAEVEMNRINGFDFISRLVSQHPEIFLVFVTNKSNYALQAFEYGAADFIIKPIDKESIKRVMKKLNKRKNNSSLL